MRGIVLALLALGLVAVTAPVEAAPIGDLPDLGGAEGACTAGAVLACAQCLVAAAQGYADLTSCV